MLFTRRTASLNSARMPSAYKSIVSQQDTSEHDVSDNNIFIETELSPSEASSSTIRASSPDSERRGGSAKAAQPRLELKNRILMLTSRGISSRHRHLLNDLHALLPHTYKDTKLDTKSFSNYNLALNSLADLHSCNYIAFLEARKHAQDLYMYLCKAPNGPTIKFRVDNVHTMAELNFGGNCLKGGRSITVFDLSFQDSNAEHKSLIREMLRGLFCVPSRGVRGMKPFVDRVTAVYWLDGRIWIRFYELREAEKEKREGQKENTALSLIEIGPRFVMTPVLILEGSFGGAVIYKNAQYISGNQVRSEKSIRRPSKRGRG